MHSGTPSTPPCKAALATEATAALAPVAAARPRGAEPHWIDDADQLGWMTLDDEGPMNDAATNDSLGPVATTQPHTTSRPLHNATDAMHKAGYPGGVPARRFMLVPSRHDEPCHGLVNQGYVAKDELVSLSSSGSGISEVISSHALSKLGSAWGLGLTSIWCLQCPNAAMTRLSITRVCISVYSFVNDKVPSRALVRSLSQS